MTVFLSTALEVEIWRWRFGAGTGELDRGDVIAVRLVAFLVLGFPRRHPVATEDPRHRPIPSVVVLQELVVDSTGSEHVTNTNIELSNFVQTLCLVLTVYDCSDSYMTEPFVYLFDVLLLLLLLSNKLFKKLSQKLLAVRKHETEKKRWQETADHRSMLFSQ